MKEPIASETPLGDIFKLTDTQKRALKKLDLHTAKDILYHFPARYIDAAQAATIETLKKGDRASVFGKIHGLKTRKAFSTLADGFIAT